MYPSTYIAWVFSIHLTNKSPGTFVGSVCRYCTYCPRHRQTPLSATSLGKFTSSHARSRETLSLVNLDQSKKLLRTTPHKNPRLLLGIGV